MSSRSAVKRVVTLPVYIQTTRLPQIVLPISSHTQQPREAAEGEERLSDIT